MPSKKSAIFNYVPHKRIKDDDNFQEWFEHYKDHLINMYLEGIKDCRRRFDSCCM